ncbi:hypothetical protein NIES2101_11970 [Calothrix sp. HK-06]|nr:hypothetical protein NIES2101_11970 [Calothrix sp. HK-06]
MAFKLLLFLGSVVCGFFLAANLSKITSPPENVKLFWKKIPIFFAHCKCCLQAPFKPLHKAALDTNRRIAVNQ